MTIPRNVSLSICVPAFNEERSLEGAVEDLMSTLLGLIKEVEIIIVDDGSTDSTAQVADRLSDKYCQVRVIRHAKKSGVGVSYRDALAVARGDYFTWFPGDHEDSAPEFTKYISYLDKDTVVTCHHLGYDCRSSLRRFVSRTYTWILNRCFNLDLKYYNGLAIFPTSTVRSFPLAAGGFALFAENLIRAAKKGCRVVELRVPLNKRKWGRSNALTFSSISQMIRDILQILIKR